MLKNPPGQNAERISLTEETIDQRIARKGQLLKGRTISRVLQVRGKRHKEQGRMLSTTIKVILGGTKFESNFYFGGRTLGWRCGYLCGRG